MTDNIDRRLLEARGRTSPEYWISRLDEYDDETLFADWRQIVFDFEVDGAILDHLFRHLKERLDITLGTLRREYNIFLRQNGADGVALSHIEWAESWAENAPPFFAEDGMLWIYNDEALIYEGFAADQLALRIARDCRGAGATKLSDHKAIARLIYAGAEEHETAIERRVGFASEREFIGLTDKGELYREPLGIEHRALFKLPVSSWEFRDGLFKDLIEFALDDDQRSLLAEHMGAVLFGVTWRFQRAILWYGAGATGKTTLQKIIEAFFPKRLVSAVPPHLWQQEYHAAAMAGKLLNVVGEVDDRYLIDAAFKNVTGGGIIPARHPTHQPFSFISRASHVFCTNHLPPTADRSSAFWRRWTVLQFDNIVPEGDRDPLLAEKIIEGELDSVIGFAIEGAQRLMRQNGFSRTGKSAEIADNWALEADSFLAFLRDEDWCELAPGAFTAKRSLYKTYTEWCRENGMRPMGSRRVKREIETSPNIIKLGIKEGRTDDRRRVYFGVRIVAHENNF